MSRTRMIRVLLSIMLLEGCAHTGTRPIEAIDPVSYHYKEPWRLEPLYCTSDFDRVAARVRAAIFSLRDKSVRTAIMPYMKDITITSSFRAHIDVLPPVLFLRENAETPDGQPINAPSILIQSVCDIARMSDHKLEALVAENAQLYLDLLNEHNVRVKTDIHKPDIDYMRLLKR